MAEEIVQKFVDSMQNGFMNGLILSILERGPTHGYKIKKEIEERSLGVWDPPISTIYSILKQMTERELIKCDEVNIGGRDRKNYDLTPKGKNTLQKIWESHEMIKISVDSILSVLFLDDLGKVKEKMHGFTPFSFIDSEESQFTSYEEKIEFLEQQRHLVSFKLQEIDNALKKLKKQLEKK